jgi:hypothetical protein
VLASSIDFKVEFKLVALVQLPHARPFDSTDVHERVGLAVVTRDEAEAFHRVEELDRSGCLFAGKLALRCGRLGRDLDHVANDLKVCRRDLAATIDEVEFELLAFSQAFKAGAFDSTDVHEHVFAAVFTLNEAEALLRVEELYDALAGADNLGGHAAASATAAATGTAEAATAAAARAAEAATAAASTTAEAATVTAAEAAAITTAEASTTAAEATTIKATASKTAATAAVGIETAFVAKTIALVASATPPPSVKTHKNR